MLPMETIKKKQIPICLKKAIFLVQECEFINTEGGHGSLGNTLGSVEQNLRQLYIILKR
jgi:hypothetical protein